MQIRSFVSSSRVAFLFLFLAALSYSLVLWQPTSSPPEQFLVLASATPGSAGELSVFSSQPASRAGVEPAPVERVAESAAEHRQPSTEPLPELPEEYVGLMRVGFAVGESKNIYVGDPEQLEVDGDAFSVQLLGDGVVSVEALAEGSATMRGYGFELELDCRGSGAGSADDGENSDTVPPDGVELVELEVGDAYPVALFGVRDIFIGNPRVIDIRSVRDPESSNQDFLIQALRPGQSSLELGDAELLFRVHPTS